MFEQGLQDLYDVARLLRTNSCYINEQNGTDETSTHSPSAEALSGNVVSAMRENETMSEWRHSFRNPWR